MVGFIKRNSAGAEYDDQILHEIEQHAAEKEKGAKGVGGSAPEDVDSDLFLCPQKAQLYTAIPVTLASSSNAPNA